jgi:D-sedoheptulose 7-phosphate isomerase
MIDEYLKGSQAAISSLGNQSIYIEKIVHVIKNQVGKGRKILICGNGGSAADAQHFAAELVGRFEKNRPAISCIALTTDTSIITAVGNDFGYENIFTRQIESLGEPGDILIAISTSGSSKNIVKAARFALDKGLIVFSLIGSNPSELEHYSTWWISINTERTCHIQEAHEVFLHYLAGEIENTVDK